MSVLEIAVLTEGGLQRPALGKGTSSRNIVRVGVVAKNARGGRRWRFARRAKMAAGVT